MDIDLEDHIRGINTNTLTRAEIIKMLNRIGVLDLETLSSDCASLTLHIRADEIGEDLVDILSRIFKELDYSIQASDNDPELYYFYAWIELDEQPDEDQGD